MNSETTRVAAVLAGQRLDGLDAIVARLVADLGEGPPSHTQCRPGHPWVGLTTSYALYVGYDEATHARVHAEGERLVWAARCELPIPEVIARGSGWLVAVRAADHKPLPDGSYAAAAIAAARRIGAATSPPLVAAPGPASHRLDLPRLQRLGRMLRSTALSHHEYKRLTREVARIPKDQLSHGDFSPVNVLFDADRRAVTVVDWELLGYRPAHYDLCKLWPLLTSEKDREMLLDAALADTADRSALGVLHRWTAMLHLVRLVTGALRPQNYADCLAAAKERVAESRANAKRWER